MYKIILIHILDVNVLFELVLIKIDVLINF